MKKYFKRYIRLIEKAKLYWYQFFGSFKNCLKISINVNQQTKFINILYEITYYKLIKIYKAENDEFKYTCLLFST